MSIQLAQPQLDVFATLNLATILGGTGLWSVVSSKPRTHTLGDYPQPRTGRDALRWHCALIV